jgi:hypothetical protein
MQEQHLTGMSESQEEAVGMGVCPTSAPTHLRLGKMRFSSDSDLRATQTVVISTQPMGRRTIANGIGCLSVACSLAFWAWAALLFFTPLNRSEAWLSLGVGTGASYFWLTMWIAGLLLAIIAAVLGSRWWISAAILAVASFAAVIVTFSTIQW